MLNIYGPDSLRGKIEDYYNSLIYGVETRELKVETYANATVLPYSKKDVRNRADVGNTDTGGVFDKNFNIVELSKDRWAEDAVKVGAPQHYDFGSDIEYIDEDVVYIGHFDNHFGHFLIESLKRLWIYLDGNCNRRAVYISEKDSPYLEIFEVFGIGRDRLMRVEKPTRFKSVAIPEESHLISSRHYNIKYLETFNRIRENSKGCGYDKIYLSRAKFKNNAIYGEEAIENIFKKNGFKIVYPETLSLKEQISLMKDCKHLAGIQGTALHLSLFAADNIELTCLYRCDSNFFIQIFINKVKNITGNHVAVYRNIFPVSSNSFPYIVGINEYMEEYLKSHSFTFDKSDDKKLNEKKFHEYIDDWVMSFHYMNNHFYLDPIDSADVIELGNNIENVVDIGEIEYKRFIRLQNCGGGGVILAKKLFNKFIKTSIRLITIFIFSKPKRKEIRSKLIRMLEIK